MNILRFYDKESWGLLSRNLGMLGFYFSFINNSLCKLGKVIGNY